MKFLFVTLFVVNLFIIGIKSISYETELNSNNSNFTWKNNNLTIEVGTTDLNLTLSLGLLQDNYIQRVLSNNPNIFWLVGTVRNNLVHQVRPVKASYNKSK